MIKPEGHSIEYLLDYRDGKIREGLGIGTELDINLRFKPSQLNIILGHDNVGKTYWIMWYFLALTSIHNLKWCIWSGENNSGQLIRDLIQMYSGRPFKSLTHQEIKVYSMKIDNYFKFVDNSKLYTPNDLLKIFEESDCDACLIDPFTGLDRPMGYEANYEFLNKAREFCNRTKKTLYINTHPNTESGRASMLYDDKNPEWKGHLKPPLKDHIEGGKAFLNRCDDMIVIHRLIKHDSMRYQTMINVEKVKDQDTGGKITYLNTPIMHDWNSGLGFKCGGIDAIKRVKREPKKDEDIFTGSPLSRPNPMPQEIQNFYEVLDKEDDFKPMDDDCPF
jgi:hypothetical protein